MDERKLFNLTEDDEPFLQGLIDSKIKETLNLEYKRELPEHKKFARKVSSFANGIGGIIILGIEEKDHLPIKLNPLVPDLGETVESIIINNIDPPLPVKITSINSTKEKDKKYYILYIPKSSNGPHMVISEKDFRYYKRGYIRKNFSSIPMNDREVREALEKNLKFKESQLLKIRKKRIKFYIEEVWDAQSSRLSYLRLASKINTDIDVNSIKPKLFDLHKDVDGKLGLLLSNDIRNYGTSIVFEKGLITNKELRLLEKRYLLIDKSGYIEYVWLDIKREYSLGSSGNVDCIRKNLIIESLEEFLLFLRFFLGILSYMGEAFIYARLNNINDTYINTGDIIQEFSQKSSESYWEESGYYQSFEIIDNHLKIAKHYADGIYRNYGYDNSPG